MQYRNTIMLILIIVIPKQCLIRFTRQQTNILDFKLGFDVSNALKLMPTNELNVSFTKYGKGEKKEAKYIFGQTENKR